MKNNTVVNATEEIGSATKVIILKPAKKPSWYKTWMKGQFRSNTGVILAGACSPR